jgi:fumarate hydratase class II
MLQVVMIHNLLHSIRLIHDASHGFVEYCIAGMTIDRERIDSYLRHSLMLVTALNGTSATTTRQRLPRTLTRRASLCASRRLNRVVDGEQFDEWVKPKRWPSVLITIADRKCSLAVGGDCQHGRRLFFQLML